MFRYVQSLFLLGFIRYRQPALGIASHRGAKPYNSKHHQLPYNSKHHQLKPDDMVSNPKKFRWEALTRDEQRLFFVLYKANAAMNPYEVYLNYCAEVMWHNPKTAKMANEFLKRKKTEQMKDVKSAKKLGVTTPALTTIMRWLEFFSEKEKYGWIEKDEREYTFYYLPEIVQLVVKWKNKPTTETTSEHNQLIKLGYFNEV